MSVTSGTPNETGAGEALATDQQRQAELTKRLDDLGRSLADKRKRAIQARRSSGIETIWREDQEAYEGIDDENRATEGGRGQHWQKPTASGSTDAIEADPTKSIILPNITDRYVDAAAARVADVLLPLDDWPFAIEAPPVPELVEAVEVATQVIDAPNPAAPVDQAAQVKAAAEAEIKKAKDAAKKAETRVKGWLIEGGWHKESREQIDDSARLGTGIIKGPFPTRKKQCVWKDGAVIVNDETKPVSKRVSVWNVYPDYPACGENIHNGSFIWEYDELTKRALADLKGGTGPSAYIDAQIDACLEEGPQDEVDFVDGDAVRKTVKDDNLFRIWYFYGSIQKENMEAAGCSCDDKYISVPAMLTMVNNRVIKASLNPQDSGRFPYQFFVWQRRAGMPWGRGVARQVRPAQRMLTAATRTMLENAGLSAKPMLAFIEGILHPTDRNMTLYGGKTFTIDKGADIQQAQHALFSIQIDSRQAECMGIIQFALKMAEDVTGISMLLQSPMGEQRAPDRVGVAQIMQGNSSSLLRRVSRQFDNQSTEPSIQDYYTWLLQYGEDESEKGLFIVNARGASVLAERDIQSQGIMRLVDMSVNPAFGADPKKAYAMAAQALRQRPEDWQYDDAEWKKMMEAQQKGHEDPRVIVARMNAERDAAIERARENFEARQEQDRKVFEAAQADLDRQLAQSELSSEERRDLEKQKVLLASLTIKIKAQKDLEIAGHTVDLHKHRTPPQLVTPPTEPAGRAEDGKAFQQ